MTGGYFEQKRASPASFATVVLLHAAVLGSVILIKGPAIIGPDFGRTKVTFVEPPAPPPPEKAIESDRPLPDRRTTVDRQTTVVDLGDRGPTVIGDPLPPPRGDDLGISARPPEPIHVPVRRNPELDPRFASALQPPYPASEQRAGREGMVRMRVTIGVDGRVRAVERISATSEDFWRVAERQALTRWRFRPATLDGRPVEGTRVMTLHFRLEGLA